MARYYQDTDRDPDADPPRTEPTDAERAEADAERQSAHEEACRERDAEWEWHARVMREDVMRIIDLRPLTAQEKAWAFEIDFEIDAEGKADGVAV